MRKKTKALNSQVGLAAKRVQWIKYKSVRILHLDFSNMSAEGSLAMIDAFEKAIAKEKPASVLLLSTLAGAEFDASVATRWRQSRVAHKHLIERSANTGASGLVLTAVKATLQMFELIGFKEISARFKICEDEESAKAWLLK